MEREGGTGDIISFTSHRFAAEEVNSKIRLVVERPRPSSVPLKN